MPRRCTICDHPDRHSIDKALVAGESFRNIAKRTGTSVGALHRHREEHLPKLLATVERREERHAASLAGQVQRQEATGRAQALDVVQQLRTINGAALTVLRDARAAQDGELMLKAIDRVQKQIELQAKLLGDLDDRPQVNVLVTPEWVALRGRILAALAPFPEARAALAEALDHAG